MYPVLVCIAKQEQDYIEEFIQYHLSIGFKHIFLYDNEDEPFYETFLQKYKEFLTVHHLPFNNYPKAVQYTALDHFTSSMKDPITHVMHIDIDEFLVLKKHKTIQEFIEEYIVDSTVGIGVHWRLFGDSGRTEKTNEPVTKRFTMCQEKGDMHIKTLFKRDAFVNYRSVHDITTLRGFIKSTNGSIVRGPFHKNIDLSVIQLNHYKCKTWPEFQQIRKRQRADIKGDHNEDVKKSFDENNFNEVEDTSLAYFGLTFYKSL